MLIPACLSLLFLAAPADAPALSIPRARQAIVRELTDQVFVRLGLGDGRGAARAVSSLAAVAAGPEELSDPAFEVLDLYTNTDLPADLRSRLIAKDADTFREAADELTAALDAITGRHALPADITRPVVLGADSGCPFRRARAIAEGPGGQIIILDEGAAVFDGEQWQAIPPHTLPIPTPVRALYVDETGRTWLGSATAESAGDRLIDRLRQGQRGVLGYFRGVADGPAPGRWRGLSGTGEVTSFAETSAGVWIAGPSRLFRYDGQRGLPAACPLPYSPTRTLLAASDGEGLWVVDAHRISQFDGVRWHSYKLPGIPALGGALLDGAVVVPLTEGLLVVENGGTRLIEADAEHGRIAVAAAGRDGSVWCLTENGTLLNTDRTSWTIHSGPIPEEDRTPTVPALFCDSGGRVWLSRGLGVELYDGGSAAGTAQEAVSQEIELRSAPLVNQVGAGGWLEGWATIEPPDVPDADDTPDTVELVSGFPQDHLAADDTHASLLEKLGESPQSSVTFNKLVELLATQPDESTRKRAYLLAAGGENRIFFEDAEHVAELARVFLDGGRPADAYLLLLDALTRGQPPEYDRQLYPTLFEALVEMGFGEFARPGFVEFDLAWQQRDGIRLVRTQVERPPLDGLPDLKYTLRFVTLDADEDAGRDAARRRGLSRLVVLIDKRAVLMDFGREERWDRLIDTYREMDRPSDARRYAKLRDDILGAEHPGAADEDAAPSPTLPYRWVRRFHIETDSAMPPVAGGDGRVYLYDEGTGEVSSVCAQTGERRTYRMDNGLDVRTLIPAPDGALAIGTWQDGVGAVRVSADDQAPDIIEGLSTTFDGFSIVPAGPHTAFCFDEGLVRLDLRDLAVSWRNRDVMPGVAFWQTLTERPLPVLDGGELFVVAGSRVYAVDAEDGSTRWSAPARPGTSPAVVGQMVVVGGSKGLIGLDREAGEVVWGHITTEDPSGPLVTDGRRIFWATRPGVIIAIDGSTGELHWRRPSDVRLRSRDTQDRPTALAVHGQRLIACNAFGWFEFDPATGALLRRLPLQTARPLAVTEHEIVVATAPNRLVCVAPPTGSIEGAVELARELARGAPEPALRLARLIAAYASPAELDAHQLALDLASREQPAQLPQLYMNLLENVDVFATQAMDLMRTYLAEMAARLPATTLHRIVDIHLERAAAHEAAQALAPVVTDRSDVARISALLRLRAASGQNEEALAVARQLAGRGIDAAAVGFFQLAREGMTEDALELALRYAGRTGSETLVVRSLVLAERVGRLDIAEQLLGRSAALEKKNDERGDGPRVCPFSPGDRALSKAFLLAEAGVASVAIAKYNEDLQRRMERYLEILSGHRDAAEADGQAEQVEEIDRQVRRLRDRTLP